MEMTTIQFPVQPMPTVVLVEHLCNIFLDIVLPALVLWIGYSVRSWIPREVGAHQEVSDLTHALRTLMIDSAAQQIAKKAAAEQK